MHALINQSLRYLPLIIGDQVPEDDPYWENFLTHLSILDYLFAPICINAVADYVAMLTEDYLVDFKKLYPDRALTPKMHFMIHLPTWMKR